VDIEDLEADPDSLVGQVVASRYRVEARLGHGAMGTVYRARHIKVGRAFAIKVLHSQFVSDDKTRRRFAREAELAGSLHHPNIVSVVDAGETLEGLRYLVMEFVDGTTLFDLIADAAPMPAARVISIVRQLCDGLAHAHERGLIHRDFKTENVIVEAGPDGSDIPKIADFGIAILRDDAASSNPERLTTAGLVLGTPHYMAPEHATGGAIDHRIDLFALGVMCFEMLTGRPPFDGDGVDVARANLLAETPIMSVRVPGLVVDPLLEALTRKLMMKSRDARPPTAAAARELVDLIARDRPAAAAALDVPFDAMFEPPRASTALWSGHAAGIPQAVPEVQSARHVTAGPVAVEPTQLALQPSTLTRAPLPGGLATAAPSAPHAAPWASEAAIRAATAPLPAPPDQAPASPHPTPPQRAPWIPDETEQIRPVSSRRAALAIAAVAALAVVLALVIALRPHRAARTAPPVAAPPTAARSDGTGEPAAPPAPMASAPAPTREPTELTPPTPPPIRAPAETAAPSPPVPSVARPLRAAARPALPGKPASSGPVTSPEPGPSGPVAPSPVATPAEASPPPSTDTAAISTAPPAPPAVLTAPPAKPAAPATPANVARLYASVGKQLKALDQARGSAATADLWLLYLRVRINDVIANPVKCAEADALLHDLDHEIVRRSH
jgi:serine/threonine-protein kinase